MNRLRLSGSTRLRHVLGGDHGALDHEDVELGLGARGGELRGALRGHRRDRDDAGGADLLDPLGDELGAHRLEVHLLHPRRGLVVVQLADLVEQRRRVLVAGPQPLQVEDARPAETAELDRRRGAHDPVHRRAEERQLEAERVELPGDVDVLWVARPPARHDRDVVEAVGPPTRLVDPDLDLCHGALRFAVRSPDRPRRSPILPARWLRPPPPTARPRRPRGSTARQDARRRTPDRLAVDLEEEDRERAVAVEDPGRRAPPSLLSEDAVGEQLGERHVEARARPRSGWGRSDGTTRQDADVGADDRARGERDDRAEPRRSARRHRVRGPPPRGPRAARRRAVASPGSRRPPGKATSPRCRRSVSARRVSTMRASPSSSKHATSTALSRSRSAAAVEPR